MIYAILLGLPFAASYPSDLGLEMRKDGKTYSDFKLPRPPAVTPTSSSNYVNNKYPNEVSVTRYATGSSSDNPVADDIKLNLVDYISPKYSDSKTNRYTDALSSNNLAMPMSQSATSTSSGARFENVYLSTNFNTPIYWSSPSY